MEQVALRQVLEHTVESDGKYTMEFPPSVCFGVVVCGGIVIAAVHKAAQDFVSRDSRTVKFKQLLDISTHFYRPTLPAPKKTVVGFKVSNLTKAGVTLHVEVAQGKTCIAGYVTLGVFSPNKFQGVSPNLLPAPVPTSINKLENDDDENWVPYHHPFAIAGNRAASTYIKYHLNPTMRSPNFVDHWLTPNWNDDTSSSGAVWTNELVHYLVDSSTALWLDPALRVKIYQENIAVGLRQKQARKEGKSDIVEGGFIDLPYMAASLFITTAIKKLLPPEGIKWVFMRTSTTGHANNRIDYHIVLMDAEGEVIATSKQVMMLIPLSGKEARL